MNELLEKVRAMLKADPYRETRTILTFRFQTDQRLKFSSETTALVPVRY